MNNEKDKSLQTLEENISTPSMEIDVTPEINEVKLEETKEEKTGFFNLQIRTRTKIILPLSILLCLLCITLIYAALYAGLEVEIWQGAIWGVCIALSIYSIFTRSIAASILNVILFFGISLIPAWQMGYNYFQPVINKLTGGA